MTTGIDGGEVHHQEVQTLGIRKGRGTLASRIALVAAVSVLLSGGIAVGVAYPLVKNEAQSQAVDQLARQADVLADVLRDSVDGTREHPGFGGPQIGHNVVVIPVDSNTSPIGPIAQTDLQIVIDGQNFSAVRELGGTNYFLEGRHVVDGKGVILVEHDTVTQNPINTLLMRMALALLCGLVIAIAVALYVAQRTAKPLKEAADAAALLAQGNRDVDVTVAGPTEVAAIAEALNQLSLNLALSEDRQREFLMSVSHELRTPMTSIKGYAEALADGVIDSSEMSSTGELLVGETGRLDRLISDLLDLARAGAVDFRLSPTVIDVASICHPAAEAWRLRCEREGLIFEPVIALEPLNAYVDATRVRQIIDNLMENAVRVTPSGGHIRLVAHIFEDAINIQVEDNGPGLSDEDLDVAFEPAVLHSRYRGVRPVGTGLGLALVGRLAERMHGTARAEHSPLGGALFTVTFPAANNDESDS